MQPNILVPWGGCCGAWLRGLEWVLNGLAVRSLSSNAGGYVQGQPFVISQIKPELADRLCLPTSGNRRHLREKAYVFRVFYGAANVSLTR